MSKKVSIKIKPQYIEYSDTMYKNFKLHKLQETFYKYDELSEINIIVAPTGTGKTFSFVLPIINKKNEKWTFRGLIVSPTNALIEDIKENIKKRFPEIMVGEINSVVLDKFNVKGPERFRTILKITNENDIIITNPDIINFIIYGGYNYYDRIREFPEIFEKFNFIVYDEYHLYDEEQIANILTLILLRKFLTPKEIKFIFTSATPEKGLEDFLRERNIPYFKYEEKISKRGRKIHGEINLNFIREDILQFIPENKDFIYNYIKNNKKVLIIFDTLRKLKEFKESNFFPELKMVELSGYTTKQETEVKTQDCQIILGTNKIEVGVNLEIDICFMEEGRYLRNFLQRFGRVARGNNNGEVFVFCNKIKPLLSKLLEREYEYYDFLDIYQILKKDREFYHQSLPKYIGTFLYAIYMGIKNYSLKKVFFENINLGKIEKEYYNKMRSINQKISKLDKYKVHPHVKLWRSWWKNFIETFRYFRENKPIVKIKDLDEDETTYYSFEWILQNKNIIKIEEEGKEKIYYVKGLTWESQPFLYVSNTLLPHSNNYFTKKEYWEPKYLFKESLKECWDKYKEDNSALGIECKEIIDEIKDLLPTITRKRINIVNIETLDFPSRII